MKYLVLLVLLLSACGPGGSGGGAANPSNPTSPLEPIKCKEVDKKPIRVYVLNQIYSTYTVTVVADTDTGPIFLSQVGHAPAPVEITFTACKVLALSVLTNITVPQDVSLLMVYKNDIEVSPLTRTNLLNSLTYTEVELRSLSAY